MKPQYKVVKIGKGEFIVADEHDGKQIAKFTTRWEAKDFADEMNKREERK